MEVYVARQPIFSADQKIYGYELLFRDGTSNFFSGIDGDTATSKVLSNSFFTIGIEKIAGNKLAFINFTQDLLIKQLPLFFPKERLVIEILEDVKPDEKVIESCREMAEKGYEIALDDFSYDDGLVPLIAMANIIKFDFRASSIEEMEEYFEKLKDHNVKFLAEKVETQEEFKKAVEMGFDYFQGYFFSKPEIIQGREISSAQMNLLQIMAEVNKPDFDFKTVEDIIARDIAISYKLMRYINSAYFRRANEISSIGQAIVLLGEKGVRSFLSLVSVTKLAEDKPDELIRSSIIRAKFCELTGSLNGSSVNPSELFTLGLFSSIDAILGDTMENLMDKLPLVETIKDALIRGEGELINFLELVKAYERGDWKSVSELQSVMKFDEEKLPEYFMDAINWADTIVSLN